MVSVKKKRTVALSPAAIKLIASVAIVVFVAGVVLFGQAYNPDPQPVPSVDILGPSALRTGDLAVFSTNKDGAKYYAWKVLPETQCQCLEECRVLVTTFPKAGTYTVLLATSNGRGVAIAQHVVVVSGDSPVPPGPDPGPDPDPEPDPQPDTGWAKWTRDTVMAEVPADGRPEMAAKLASAMKTLAAKIASGSVVDTKAARVEMRAVTNAALGAEAYKWVGFSLKFASHLESLANADKLKTLRQYQSLYEGVASGLDSIAKGAR